MPQDAEITNVCTVAWGQGESSTDVPVPVEDGTSLFLNFLPGRIPDPDSGQLIRFLIDKLSFDYQTLLIDESRDDFNAYRTEPEYQGGYEYHRPEVSQVFPQPLPFHQAQYPFGQPAPIYGPPPNNTQNQQGYNYPSPPSSHNNPFIQQLPGVSHHVPQIQQHIPRQHHTHQFVYPQVQALYPLGQNHGWWGNRYTRSNERDVVSRRRPGRSPRLNPLLEFTTSKKSRGRRQSNSSIQATPLCETNSQFIMPKAALNNRGNWMYVVNLQEQGEKYTQLVRSETCASSTCNGLCSLPAGYSSRCQQQYVQKRLVALEGSGDRLYTDVFWFPHCCTCQVTQGN